MEKEGTKLLILSNYFYPDKSSTPKVLTELAEDLVELGIDVEVVTSIYSYKGENKNLKHKDIYKGIDIKRVYSTNLDRNKYIGRILNYITFFISVFIDVIFKKDYDYILVVSNPPLLPFIGYIMNLIKGKPYIYLLYDIYPDIAIKVGVIKESSIISKIISNMNNKMFMKASKVVVLGQDMKKNLLEKNIPNDKIEIITNWADKDKIYKTNKLNKFSKDYNLENTFNVVYTGNIGRYHDVETILDSALKLKDNKNIKFVFVGDGYKKKNIEKYKRENCLKNIELFGYHYDEDYNNILNLADLFITTLDEGIEGLGVPSKTYSYIAAGKPIIAIMSSTSEIGHIVEQNKLGIRVNKGESNNIVNFIQNIIADAELYSQIQKNVEETFYDKYERKKVTKEFYRLIKCLNKGEKLYV